MTLTKPRPGSFTPDAVIGTRVEVIGGQAVTVTVCRPGRADGALRWDDGLGRYADGRVKARGGADHEAEVKHRDGKGQGMGNYWRER